MYKTIIMPVDVFEMELRFVRKKNQTNIRDKYYNHGE